MRAATRHGIAPMRGSPQLRRPHNLVYLEVRGSKTRDGRSGVPGARRREQVRARGRVAQEERWIRRLRVEGTTCRSTDRGCDRPPRASPPASSAFWESGAGQVGESAGGQGGGERTRKRSEIRWRASHHIRCVYKLLLWKAYLGLLVRVWASVRNGRASEAAADRPAT